MGIPQDRGNAENWRQPRQPHPGTRVGNYRCSLPGLAGFTTYHCEGTAWITRAGSTAETSSALQAAYSAVIGYALQPAAHFSPETLLDINVKPLNIDVIGFNIGCIHALFHR